jgi:hypothetical protein
MPTQPIVKCAACGTDAIVTSTDGVLFPDPQHRGAKIIHTIKCQNCGVREQWAPPLVPNSSSADK